MSPFWKPCAGGSAGMLIFPYFPNVFEGSWETVCAHANRVRIILHRSSEVIAYALTCNLICIVMCDLICESVLFYHVE